MLELVFHDPLRMSGHALDHAAVGFREVGIVFEEIHVTQDMSDHHFVLHRTIGFQQKAVCRIGVNDDFIDF